MIKIGLIDSGLGGISVLRDFLKNVSNVQFYYYADLKYAPYGEKDSSFVKNRVFEIVDSFFVKKVDILLIACNTATKVCIKDLRKKYSFPIFGMQPALKPALLENQKVLVMATPLMLKNNFYPFEIPFSVKKNIFTFSCFGLSYFIDNMQLNEIEKYVRKISLEIKKNEVKILVLGCTHYVFLKNLFRHFLPFIKFYDGNLGTIRHIIKTCHLPKYKIGSNFYEIYSSHKGILYRKTIEKLLKFNFGEGI